MSLDVSLYGEPIEDQCKCECGHQHFRSYQPELFTANITHNLGQMAAVAGIYKAVWRPEEDGLHRAADLIGPLREGIACMKVDPAKFRAYDAANGWGTYTDFIPWLEKYLAACEEYPNAEVKVSR
jgi:hypothetical protein